MPSGLTRTGLKAFIVSASVGTASTTTTTKYRSTALIVHGEESLITWFFPFESHRNIQTVGFTLTVNTSNVIKVSARYFGVSLTGSPAQMAVDTAYNVVLTIMGAIYSK